MLDKIAQLDHFLDEFRSELRKAGFTFIDYRTKITSGKNTGIPCLTIGVKRKLRPLWLKLLRRVDLLDYFRRMWPIDLIDIVEAKQAKIPLPDPTKPRAYSPPETHQKKVRPVRLGVSYIACGSSACSLGMVGKGIEGHPTHRNCRKITMRTPLLDLDGKKILGAIDFQVGDDIVSSSRSAGHTYGKIISVTVFINVNYNRFLADIGPAAQHSAIIKPGSSSSPGYRPDKNGLWYGGANFAGADAPDQNFLIHQRFIASEYGLDFNWMKDKPDGTEIEGCFHAVRNYHCGMNFVSGGDYPVGHPFTQPSPLDGGICPTDVVAFRSNFVVPVRPDRTNRIDAAMDDIHDASLWSQNNPGPGPVPPPPTDEWWRQKFREFRDELDRLRKTIDDLLRLKQ